MNSEKREKVILNICDLLDFNYQKSKYDRILLIEVLQHIPLHEKKIEIIKKLFEAIKKNGLLLSINYLWGGYIKPPQKKEDFNYDGTGLYRYAFTYDDIKNIFSKSGFKRIENIGIIRSPYLLRKVIPPIFSFIVERSLIELSLFNKRSKYLLTVGYK